MQQTYIASKRHYEILDGLRGVAALLVVAFHLFETYSGGAATQIINHGYLAVDFFFVLSGFVIGYAYDDRWGNMSLKNFFKRRITRLHPMVIMGSLIGAAFFYLADSTAFPLIGQTPWCQMLLMLLMALLMIPSVSAIDIRGWGENYPLNGPTWSLFLEYIANILYATVIRHFSKTVLAIFVAVAAFLTLNLTMDWNIFGLLGNRPDRAYTVIGGWAVDSPEAFVGVSRLLYPFFMGLMLSRINRLIKLRAGFWWCSLLIAAVLVMPRLSTEGWVNGLYESLSILILFPLIVSIGAGSSATGRSAAFCHLLGQLSYPLYIVHYPLVYLQIAWASSHPDAPTGEIVTLSAGVYIASIALAYACLKLYDLPVRHWLKVHWLMK
jgi:peptidoglycan/LPS O-acetylase OafA/YrhL